MRKRGYIFNLFLSNILIFSLTSCINSNDIVQYEIMDSNRYNWGTFNYDLCLYTDYSSFVKDVENKQIYINYYDYRIDDDYFKKYNLLYVPFKAISYEKQYGGGIVIEGIFLEEDVAKIKISVGVDGAESHFGFPSSINHTYLIKLPKLELEEKNYVLETYVRGNENLPAYYYRFEEEKLW